MSSYNEKYFINTCEIEQRIMAFLINSYRSLAIVKSFNLISPTMNNLKKLHKEYFKIGFNGEVISQMHDILSELIVTLSNYGTYILIGFFIINKRIDFPTATELIVISSSLYAVSNSTFTIFT